MSLEQKQMDPLLEQFNNESRDSEAANEGTTRISTAPASGEMNREIDSNGTDERVENIGMARFVFGLLGVGTLLPWNAFISAEPYFQSRLCTLDSSDSHHSDMSNDMNTEDQSSSSSSSSASSSSSHAKDFMLWFGLVYNSSSVATLGILLICQKIRSSRAASSPSSSSPPSSSATEETTQSLVGDDAAVNDACSPCMTPMRVENELLEMEELDILYCGDHWSQQPNHLHLHNNSSNSNTNNHQHYQHQQQQQQQTGHSSSLSLPKRILSSILNQTKRHHNPSSTLQPMIIIPLTIYLTILLGTTILVLIPPNSTPLLSSRSFFFFTLAGLAACGSSNAFAAKNILKFANLFPSHLGVAPYISSQALGGVFISSLNLISSALVHENVDDFWVGYCTHHHHHQHAHYDDDNPDAHDDNVLDDNVLDRNEDGSLSWKERMLLLNSKENHCQTYSTDWGAFFYFSAGCLTLAMCIGFYIYLERSPITRHYRALALAAETSITNDDDHHHHKKEDKDNTQNSNPNHDNTPIFLNDQWQSCRFFGDNDGIWSSHWLELEHDANDAIHCSNQTKAMLIRPLLSNNGEPVDSSHMLKPKPPQQQQQQQQSQPQPPQPSSDTIIIPIHPTNPKSNDLTEDYHHTTNTTTYVWKRIRLPAISIFLTFFITLAIFPSWITKVQSVQMCHDPTSRFRNDLFVPCIILLYNIGDLAGRTTCQMIHIEALSKRKLSLTLLVAALARIAFFPLFLLCRAEGSILVPPVTVFYHDFYPLFFLALFAFSNGVISALSFLHAPRLIPQNDEVHGVASTILNFAVGLGLLCGSGFSFMYNYLGTGQS